MFTMIFLLDKILLLILFRSSLAAELWGHTCQLLCSQTDLSSHKLAEDLGLFRSLFSYNTLVIFL